jgi:hypothetical protein
MHTLSTGIHISKPLRIKVVNLFPYMALFFNPPSSLFLPSLQMAPTFVLLASIGEIQAAFGPADPQAIAAKPQLKWLSEPDREVDSFLRKSTSCNAKESTPTAALLCAVRPRVRTPFRLRVDGAACVVLCVRQNAQPRNAASYS